MAAQVRNAGRYCKGRIGRLLEALEERQLLSVRFVVPIGIPVNNTDTFVDLQDALTEPGLTIGDTIQIEPGSMPGNVTAAGPGVANLTIQGDPNAALASIPQFTLSATFTVGPTQSVFTLKNVNMGLIADIASGSGSLVGSGNLVIRGSSIININSHVNRAVVLGGSTNVLANSSFVDSSLAIDMVQLVTPASGSNNTISRNTFVANATGLGAALHYLNGAGVAVTDQVISNTFSSVTGTTIAQFIMVEEPGISGLTFQGNTFTGPTDTVAIQLRYAARNVTISNNDMSGKTGGGGVDVNGSAGATSSVLIFNNQFTGGGATLEIIPTVATAVLNLNIAGNDFQGAIDAVVVGGTGTFALGGIDLGGGSQGSVGGNNFRGFGAYSSGKPIAFDIENVSTATGSVSAQKNIFSDGVDPASTEGLATGKVNLSNPLTGNAAFVATLYDNFLKRPGNTANAADAGFWVNALNASSMTTAQAAAAIAKSPEALGALVDGLYGRFLGRSPDAGGRAYFVGVLSTAGQGAESMINQLVTSPEYTAQFASNGNFVQSLYTRLLGRVGPNSEIAFWVNTLASSSRAAVAASILSSAEFRGDVVRQLYGFTFAPPVATASIFVPLLYRTVAPGAAEINYWVNSGQDLLTLDVAFAQTGEYFTNG